ncbi:conserved hypothetical protein [Trichinella spiralis]|uniref:hypothetical protein n=1 Tax=Trichinella spiralis TaxID=6334 RepID=UPI0001EFCBAF|nr:conserved hypothetical protein [Trichinella spiralis]
MPLLYVIEKITQCPSMLVVLINEATPEYYTAHLTTSFLLPLPPCPVYPPAPSPSPINCCIHAVHSLHNAFRVVYGRTAHPATIHTAPSYFSIYHSSGVVHPTHTSIMNSELYGCSPHSHHIIAVRYAPSFPPPPIQSCEAEREAKSNQSLEQLFGHL